MLQDGAYRAVPVSAVLGRADTGKEQICVQFQVATDDGPTETITWYGYFTDATFERTIEALRYCGWRGNDLLEFLSGRQLPAGFDQEVQIVIESQEYNGKWSPRVRWVNSGSGIGVKNALSEEEGRAFSARMKGRVASLQAKSPASAAAAAPARSSASARGASPAEAIPEDDLLF